MAARKLVIHLPPYTLFRRVAGILFITGNLTLFATNLVHSDFLQLISGLIFMSGSVALMLSARNHRYLFYCSATVVVGYILVSISGGEGDGTLLKHIGGLAGLLGGLLVFRAALQRETNKQINLPKPLDLIDKYPLAASGTIEGICCAMIALGAFMNTDYRLMFVVTIWFTAHICLIASDEYLRTRFGI